MDLLEVEGLADLLAADTEAQRRQVGGSMGAPSWRTGSNVLTLGNAW
jgi:hypothetical protein